MHLRNVFDAGSPDSQPTATESGNSGDPFSLVNQISSAMKYTTRSLHGGTALKWEYTALSNNPLVEWQFTAASEIFARYYYWTDDHPTANQPHIRIQSGSTGRAGLRLNADGTISVCDGVNGSSTFWTSSVQLATEAWNRIEVRFALAAGVSSVGEVRLYSGEDSTPYDSGTSSAFNANGSDADTFRIGKIFGESNTQKFVLDTLDIGDLDWFGSARGGAPIYPLVKI